jgi:hypothetical protein
MVLDPFFINRDVTLKKMHAWMFRDICKAVVLHIHAIYFPIGCFQNTFGEVVANKPIYTKD